MSASGLRVVQFRLDQKYPGSKVRAAFAGDTKPPDQRGLGWLGGTGSELDFLLLPMAMLVAGVQAIFRRRNGTEGTRLLVVVTDKGTALARCRGSVGRPIASWVHGPIPGLRYELDPLDATTGAAEIQLTLGEQTLWARGADRDAARTFEPGYF